MTGRPESRRHGDSLRMTRSLGGCTGARGGEWVEQEREQDRRETTRPRERLGNTFRKRNTDSSDDRGAEAVSERRFGSRKDTTPGATGTRNHNIAQPSSPSCPHFPRTLLSNLGKGKCGKIIGCCCIAGIWHTSGGRARKRARERKSLSGWGRRGGLVAETEFAILGAWQDFLLPGERRRASPVAQFSPAWSVASKSKPTHRVAFL
ncbi:polyprenyl synthetase [Anopheles sinensis]|uniref:Polyprenyl synthetase n=1 Tax=Anopheles sinensis TaxID=74873 RepID=A0A084VE58_ANOSI|nr:polyprenyl synthetase [Anopheles sinensis]